MRNNPRENQPVFKCGYAARAASYCQKAFVSRAGWTQKLSEELIQKVIAPLQHCGQIDHVNFDVQDVLACVLVLDLLDEVASGMVPPWSGHGSQSIP